MKTKKGLVLCALALLSSLGINAQTTFQFEGNPLVKHIYTADPTARVFKGKLYLYTSHDRNDATYFDMNNWRLFSTPDLKTWTDHGNFFALTDIKWARSLAWAIECVERNGNYYLYYPVERKQIGVGVSKSPEGPFVDSGKPLLDNTGKIKEIGREPIDPTVIVDKGQAYIYWGCRDFRMAKLKDNMTEIEGDIMYPKIIGNENDKEGDRGFYGEGPFIFKRKDIFYLMYSNGWSPKSTLVYATAKNPLGPFTYQGEVMHVVSSFTSHGSIVNFKGKWYIFYHNKDLSTSEYRRSVCFDELHFDDQGKIIRLN